MIIYFTGLKNSIKLLELPKDIYSSFHLKVVQLQNKDIEKYEQIFNGLREIGIGVQLHYIPVHLQHYYQDLGFKEGMFPASENYSKKSFSIPLFPSLKESEQNFIKESLLKLLDD